MASYGLRGKKIEGHRLRISAKAILAIRPQRGILLETRNMQQVFILFLATRNSQPATFFHCNPQNTRGACPSFLLNSLQIPG